MCLHTVDKETKQVSEGWKIIEIIDDKLYPPFYEDGIEFVTNKWIKDINKQSIKTFFNNNEYQPGFHFYFNEKDAENKLYNIIETTPSYRKFKILKVKVKNVVATGKENKYKVGVARKIFIEEE